MLSGTALVQSTGSGKEREKEERSESWGQAGAGGDGKQSRASANLLFSRSRGEQKRGRWDSNLNQDKIGWVNDWLPCTSVAPFSTSISYQMYHDLEYTI